MRLTPKCSLITAMNRWGLSNLFLLLPSTCTQREITQPYQEETDEGDKGQLSPIPCSPQVVNGVMGFVCDEVFLLCFLLSTPSPAIVSFSSLGTSSHPAPVLVTLYAPVHSH